MGVLGLATPDFRHLETSRSATLGLFRFCELAPLEGVTGLVDWRLLGALSRLVIDGFIESRAGECLLFPLGGRLPHRHLLLVGLGRREGFGRDEFVSALERMFCAAERIGPGGLDLTLPGRVEGVVDPASAVDWFLEAGGDRCRDRDLTVIEHSGVQKVMLPAIERWRLKRSLSPVP